LRYWIRFALVLAAAVGCLAGCARGKHPPVEPEQRTEKYDIDRRFSFSLFKPAYKRAVAEAHRRYRDSLDHIPVREVGLPKHYESRHYADGEPAARRSRSFRRRSVRTAVERRESPTGTTFRMNPTTPYIGSPEHTREQEYERRRERELGRRMRICATC
jgi:hypothetical protein